MTEIIQILEGFNVYELSDKLENNLMRRVDVKYVFHKSKLVDILNKASNSFRRLKTSENIIPRYESIYLDTEDFYMYTAHHNGSLNRYKIRERTYIDTENTFLEIKFKNNKKITKKVRINNVHSDHFTNTDRDEFIKMNTPFNPQNLVESVRTSFSRITLSDNKFSERITIDSDIELSLNEGTEMLEDIIVCEVKKNKGVIKSNFEKLLAELKIKPFRVSKYCLGNYYLNQGVKHNLYKEKALYINKIQNYNG